MEEILEYKKLLRQREKLMQKSASTSEEEERREIDAQIKDVDELLDHMRRKSKDVQNFLNDDNQQLGTPNSNEVVKSLKAMKDAEGENVFYGIITLGVIFFLVFLGLKSCIGCDNPKGDNKDNYALVQTADQGENERQIKEQQEEIRKQQRQIEEQEKILKKQQHEQLVRSSLSITDGEFVPNIFDGYIYFNFNLSNHSSKTIKYFYVWVDIFNSVSDPIQKNWCGKYTGPLNSGARHNVSFQLTNNQQAALYRVTRMRVEYMDGTYLEVSPDEINQIYKAA